MLDIVGERQGQPINPEQVQMCPNVYQCLLRLTLTQWFIKLKFPQQKEREREREGERER